MKFRKAYDKAELHKDLDDAIELLSPHERKILLEALKTCDLYVGITMRDNYLMRLLKEKL